MSTIAEQTTTANQSAADAWTLHRFSVEDYHEMGRIGILGPEDRVELLEGWIVKKMNLNPPHATGLNLCQSAILRGLPDGWHVRMQQPVTTGDSEPEPDLAVARGVIREYAERHPTGLEAPLVIEVADSSLKIDRRKSAIYARARVATYWIMNLNDRLVEVYTGPTGDGENASYQKQQNFKADQSVPLILDGAEVAKIPVAEILP